VTTGTPFKRLLKTHRFYPIVAAVALLIFWEAFVVGFHIGTWLLPRPSAILADCIYHAGTLLPAAWVTAQEILIGFFLSVTLGILVAIAIVSNKVVEESSYPLLVTTQLIPKIAIAPILTTWFGFGMAPKVTMCFLISFFPMVIDSIVGLRSVPIGKLQLALTMGASRGQLFTKIRLPNALPNIFGGMKIASTLAVVGALVGEFISSDQGLGRVMLLANGDFNATLLFAAITYLTVIGLILFSIIELLERLFIPWHVSRRAEAHGH
jgi:NitT/TauT family transport system permease protein